MSASNYLKNAIGNALRGGGNGTSYTAPANTYMKLHTGDPGEDCTANAAGHTTRVECSFGAASGGVISLSATVSFTSLSTAETISHVSIWDHATAGNPLHYGALAASKTVGVGDQLDITAWTATVT